MYDWKHLSFFRQFCFKVQFKCHLTRLKADLSLQLPHTAFLLQTRNRVLSLCVSLCACFPFPLLPPGDSLMSCTLPGCCSVNIYWITWKEIPGYIKRIFHKPTSCPHPQPPLEKKLWDRDSLLLPRVGRLRPGAGSGRLESGTGLLGCHGNSRRSTSQKVSHLPREPFQASSGWRALSEGSALHELSLILSRAFLSASETSKKVLSVWIRSGCVNASQ